MRAETDKWEFIDHVCRACLGRLAIRTNKDLDLVVRCSECELEAVGKGHLAMCLCGSRLRDGRDAGLRCKRVNHPAGMAPMVVGEAVEVANPKRRPPAKPVGAVSGAGFDLDDE